MASAVTSTSDPRRRLTQRLCHQTAASFPTKCRHKQTDSEGKLPDNERISYNKLVQLEMRDRQRRRCQALEAADSTSVPEPEVLLLSHNEPTAVSPLRLERAGESEDERNEMKLSSIYASKSKLKNGRQQRYSTRNTSDDNSAQASGSSSTITKSTPPPPPPASPSPSLSPLPLSKASRGQRQQLPHVIETNRSRAAVRFNFLPLLPSLEMFHSNHYYYYNYFNLSSPRATKTTTTTTSANWSALYLVMALACLLWSMSSAPTHCRAYQLTNNLIANNLPPKFVQSTGAPTGQSLASGGSSSSQSAASSSQGGGGSNSEIVVRVKEGPQSIGRLIYTLRGEDPDDDPLTFGVLGTMASDLLRIENVPGNQANVYLRKELDRETTESHQVVITLTDGKLGKGNWVSSLANWLAGLESLLIGDQARSVSTPPASGPLQWMAALND